MSRRCCSGDGRRSFWIESHRADRRPVSDCTGPSFWVRATGAYVEFAPAREDVVFKTEVAFIGRHVADGAVSMDAVVPVDEVSNPALSGGDIGER